MSEDMLFSVGEDGLGDLNDVNTKFFNKIDIITHKNLGYNFSVVKKYNYKGIRSNCMYKIKSDRFNCLKGYIKIVVSIGKSSTSIMILDGEGVSFNLRYNPDVESSTDYLNSCFILYEKTLVNNTEKQ